jgi:uncharacterized membrane protein HdeD (DUF308 family)
MTLLSTALAQVFNPVFTRNPRNQTGVDFFQGFITLAINGLVIIAGLYFFFMLVLGGMKWLSSGGDKAQVQSARDQITNALIGIVVLFSAWAVTALVGTVFGIDFLNIDLSSVVAP